MAETFSYKVIDSIEKVFRYIIPGVAFGFMLALSYPSSFTEVHRIVQNSGFSIFLLVLTVGMSIYVIHKYFIKITFELLVYKLNLSPVNLYVEKKDGGYRLRDYIKGLSMLNVERHENEEKYPSGYYTYLWSIRHYSFIMSELLILFSIFYENGSYVSSHVGIVRLGGIILLILSIFSYVYIQILEKHTTEELFKKNFDNK